MTAADPILGNFGEHAAIAYCLMIVSFAVRTAPRPKNVLALWMMGVVQFALMNLMESKANFDTLNKGTGDGK